MKYCTQTCKSLNLPQPSSCKCFTIRAYLENKGILSTEVIMGFYFYTDEGSVEFVMITRCINFIKANGSRLEVKMKNTEGIIKNVPFIM